jgi:hypothetical protein
MDFILLSGSAESRPFNNLKPKKKGFSLRTVCAETEAGRTYFGAS